MLSAEKCMQIGAGAMAGQAISLFAKPSKPNSRRRIMDKVKEMWATLAAYQPQADAAGHGPSWARMCKEKTYAAADDAAAAAAAAAVDTVAAYADADAASYAAASYAAASYAAVAAAVVAATYAVDAASYAAAAKKWAQIAIYRITSVLTKAYQ
jgi:hypothetical protein